MVDEFTGGCISNSLDIWSNITSDTSVLNTVNGLSLEFEDELPYSSTMVQSNFNSKESLFISAEIERLLAKRIIEPTCHEEGEFISPIFVTPKSDGGYRLILNLKKLNEFMPYIHFKMDTIEKILKLVRKGAYMAKIDLKDAYYSVKIDEKHQKFLKFTYRNKLYKFTCLPNGLCSGPRKFTKLLKPPLAFLRVRELIIISAYIDDLYTQNDTFDGCFQNVQIIVDFFISLGFVIHPTKSCFEPCQIMEYLGMVINTINMTVSLTMKKKLKIIELCEKLLSRQSCKISDIAKLLGYMSFGFLAVKYGKMHYRHLELQKIEALSINKGDYEAFTILSPMSRNDIRWWRDNVRDAYSDIYQENPKIVLTTDASLKGWGAVSDSESTGGLFTAEEGSEHINVLELKAVLFGLKSLLSHVSGSVIKILCDNTTAVCCINNMGSCRSLICNKVTLEIWDWAISQKNWLMASHIPGVLNEEADYESRKNETRLEWKLNEKILQDIIQYFDFIPEIDLFASRINTQFKKFVSFRPDPEASHVNAFSLSWDGLKFYAFPPFSCISRVTQKLFKEDCVGILIVPNWPNQLWFPVIHTLLLTDPYIIFSSVDQLYLPNQPQEHHPLSNNLELLACLVGSPKAL